MGQHKRYQNTHSLSSRGEDGEEVAKNKQTKKPNEIITPTMKVYRLPHKKPYEENCLFTWEEIIENLHHTEKKEMV